MLWSSMEIVTLSWGRCELKSDGYAASGLSNISNKAIKIQCGYNVRNADGKEVVYHEPRTLEFGAPNPDGDNAWGHINFAERRRLLKYLVKGTLVIEVRMKLVEESKYSSQFIPQNPINNFILNKFNDEESADVIFEVDSESKQGPGICNKSKT